MNEKDSKPESGNDDLNNLLKAAIESITPCATDPEYRYAEALLIVFNSYAAGTHAIRFNRDELYEIVTGKSSGRYNVKEADLNLAVTEDAAESQAALQRIAVDADAGEVLMRATSDFMTDVSDALTLTVLCEKYGRDLVIVEEEGASWVAVDLLAIRITDINF